MMKKARLSRESEANNFTFVSEISMSSKDGVFVIVKLYGRSCADNSVRMISAPTQFNQSKKSSKSQATKSIIDHHESDSIVVCGRL
jgi:hypothetical protein